MTLLKATVFVVTVVVNVVHVFDVVLNVVMIIMYLVLVNKRSSKAPGSYCYCWVVLWGVVVFKIISMSNPSSFEVGLGL